MGRSTCFLIIKAVAPEVMQCDVMHACFWSCSAYSNWLNQNCTAKKKYVMKASDFKKTDLEKGRMR